MDTIKFTCDVAIKDATDTPLVITATLNGEEKTSVQVTKSTQLDIDVPDIEDTEHTIELTLSGKTDSHTIRDKNGDVLSTTELVINNFQIDDINMDSIVLINSLPYTHNFNGSEETVTEKFYDTMGCNGTIKLTFTTPFYLWLLENM